MLPMLSDDDIKMLPLHVIDIFIQAHLSENIYIWINKDEYRHLVIQTENILDDDPNLSSFVCDYRAQIKLWAKI